MATLTGQSIASSYEQLLHVDRDGGGNGTTLVDVKDGDNGTTFALKLATDKVHINGDLGVGVLAPVNKLHVRESEVSGGGTDAGDTAIFEDNADARINLISATDRRNGIFFSDTTRGVGRIDYNHDTDIMEFRAGGTDIMYAKSTGIGIGTTSPSRELSVVSSSSKGGMSVEAANIPSLYLTDNHANVSRKQYVITSNFVEFGDFGIKQSSNATADPHDGTTRFYINNAGKVGIGTESPLQSIDAVGKVIIADNKSDDTAKVFGILGHQYDSGTETEGYGLVMGYSTSSMNRVQIGGGNSDHNAATLIKFFTGANTTTRTGTEKMAIDSSGNVNIGGTTAFGFTPGLSVEGTQPSLILQKDASNFFNTNVADGFVYVMFDHAAELQFGNATNVGGTGFARNFILDTNSRISLSNNDGGANNTTLGNLAGAALTTNGDRNSLFGHLAGNDISSGQENTLMGYLAGEKITTGLYNTAIGSQAFVTNVDGDHNTAIGYSALYSFEAGSDGEGNNVAIGSNASFHLDTGQQNTMVGSSAGQSSAGTITYSDNTGIGYKALFAVTTGNTNTAIGSQAGLSITTGAENTIVGDKAGDAIGVGNSNTLVGQAAGGALTDGDNNVVIGASTMAQDDLGQGSTAVGAGALSSQNMASEALTKNVGIGYQAGFYNVTGTSNSFLGYRAGFGASGQSNSNNVGVGQSALLGITTGAGNIAIGSSAGASITDGDSNTVVGYLALSSSVSAQSNTAIGRSAMQNTTTAHTNVAIGGETMGGITTATVQDATAVGYAAFKGSSSTTTGANGTIAIGRKALFALTTGAGNTAIGYASMENGGTINTSTAIGYATLQNGVDGMTGNTAIGYGVLDSANNSNADDNTGVGKEALGVLSSGAQNVAVGKDAGNVIQTGSNNVCIGKGANPDAQDGANQIVLGKDATGVADNSVTLGNADVTAVYMASDSGATVHCAGIDFSATQPAPDAGSSSSEVLDSYEEGTWTPAFVSGSGHAPSSITVTRAVYTKIGNVVTLEGNIGFDDSGGGGDAFTLSGVPFNFATNSFPTGVANLRFTAFSESTMIYALGNAGSGQLAFYYNDGNGDRAFVSYTNTDVASNTLTFTITYIV